MSDYKTVLVHADASRHAPARIELAARLAMAHEAHLTGAAMNGLPRFLYEGTELQVALQIAGEQMAVLERQAHDALDGFDAQCACLGVPAYERRQLNDDPEGGLILQARYADLLVVGQPDPDETRFTTLGDLPAYVTLNCARPVLVVPYAAAGMAYPPRAALVAWDGSPPATRAITAALPMLRRAGQVTLAIFNPGQRWGLHGEEPGADMALYLARHGVQVDVHTRDGVEDEGNALLSLAADLGASLLVMGAYGHSRFRELVLGGVTATVLSSMTIPVLLAH